MGRIEELTEAVRLASEKAKASAARARVAEGAWTSAGKEAAADYKACLKAEGDLLDAVRGDRVPDGDEAPRATGPRVSVRG